jgi:YidC/Oxa1 family membrane protein insertase
MQRRIMFALPFVFVIFIINFEAGLILYWITTNVWTIGQQLLVKKLYPKPVLDAEAEADQAASTPARGKPPSTVMAASGDGGDGENGGKDGKDGKDGGKPAAKAAAPAAGSGGARTKAPPASPRKKKKRSGRRR